MLYKYLIFTYIICNDCILSNFNICTKEGVLKAYLDTETLLPILKIVAPLFEDEAAVEQILSMLKAQAGEMAGMVDVFLKPALVAMPQIIGSTETIQIGIKMQAAQ